MQKKRWIVLGSFMGVASVNQMLWLNFPPILTLIQTRYGVSELMASSLILCFPLFYVIFAMPAGAMPARRQLA